MVETVVQIERIEEVMIWFRRFDRAIKSTRPLVTCIVGGRDNLTKSGNELTATTIESI